MKKKLAIWGASGHARVVAEIIRLQQQYEIVAFLDDIHKEKYGSEFCGAIIVGGAEKIEKLRQNGVRNLFLAIGDNKARLRLSEMAIKEGFKRPSFIHPSAVVASDAQIGSGTVVCAGAVVGPKSILGSHVIINTCASVDHECAIEDGVHIGPGAHLGGRVSVSRGAWVGIGATISDRVCLGEGSIIGAGAVVLKDIPPRVVAYGIPAKVIGR